MWALLATPVNALCGASGAPVCKIFAALLAGVLYSCKARGIPPRARHARNPLDGV